MLHNLYPDPDEVFITYDIDFIPADSPAAKGITKARPVWMDVENGQIYPVFDAVKGMGHDGVYVYPDDNPDAYKNRKAPTGSGRRTRRGGDAPATTAPAAPPQAPNTWTVDTDGVLLGTAGHLHPGGLHTDLYADRDGKTAHLFTSEANYYEPAGAVSWDVAMTATPPDWRVQVRKGDVLRMNATYDTKRGSWYESMGIMVLWMADAAPGSANAGPDPFTTKVDVKGEVTHGHLAENDNHGGGDPKMADMVGLPNGPVTDTVAIADFTYGPGDMAHYNDVPVVAKGGKLTFVNHDDKATPTGLWHTVTACKAPCNEKTGIAYPLADADIQFDSGELGTGGPPTADRNEWSVPDTLPTGTYTYFCRIHPFMRGAFRVVDGDGASGATPGGSSPTTAAP